MAARFRMKTLVDLTIGSLIMDHFFGMILAGGSGTRLWPISRENTPKQTLSLSGSNLSLLQDAFARLSKVVPPASILTVTGQAHQALILGQIRSLDDGYPEENLLAEPEGRDSAAAVLWGALRIEALDPEAVVALVWCDQLIRGEDAFQAALRRGYEVVKDGGLAVIGVPARRAATNLGYIRIGGEVARGVFAAERFVEKPDRVTAEKMVAEKCYLWNPGVFVFKLRTLLEEYRRLAPELTRPFDQRKSGSHAGWLDPAVIAEIYAELPRQSIDTLILEKTGKLLLIPAELGWSDLGTWDELHFQAEKDASGNALSGNVVAIDSENLHVRGGRRLITTVGVKDLIVVDTDDALLICNLNNAQDIKKLVTQLREKGAPEVETFGENVRPWGAYEVLAEGPGYKVKMLTVNPGQKLSLQMHRRRAEHWVVVEGTVLLTRNDEVGEFSANDYYHIPAGARHRIENSGGEVARIIEVQEGSYLGEDDIVRFDDMYGRG